MSVKHGAPTDFTAMLKESLLAKHKICQTRFSLPWRGSTLMTLTFSTTINTIVMIRSVGNIGSTVTDLTGTGTAGMCKTEEVMQRQ